MNHPYPIGTQIKSLRGERDQDNYDQERKAPPGSIGTVICADLNSYSRQGWTYGVEFPNGVFVFIDEADSINDPEKYQIIDQSPIVPRQL